MTGKIEITGVSAEDVTEQIVDRFTDEWDVPGIVHRRLNEVIQGEIRSEINALVKGSFDEQVRDIVRESIGAGWADCDSYGDRGPVKSLAKRVDEMLNKDVGGYNKPRKTMAQQVVEDTVKSYMRDEMSKDLQTVRDGFKEQVNALLQTKLSEVLADHLGLAGK